MFKNAGQKLKVKAKSTFIGIVMIGIIIALILSVALSNPLPLLIIPIAIGIGWNRAIMLYAFGELYENVYHINQTVQTNSNMKQHHYSCYSR